MGTPENSCSRRGARRRRPCGEADEHEPSAPADDGAWMDDAIVVVERNEGTGRRPVTLVDPASGFSLSWTTSRSRGAERDQRSFAPVAAVVVAALLELELKENPS